MTDSIEEIRARHEADAGLEEEDYVMSPDLTVQAHADRATLLRALTEAQERAERAEEENREMRRLLRLYAIQHGTVTET